MYIIKYQKTSQIPNGAAVDPTPRVNRSTSVLQIRLDPRYAASYALIIKDSSFFSCS